MAPRWEEIVHPCGCKQVKGDIGALVNVSWRLVLCVTHTADIRVQLKLQETVRLIEEMNRSADLESRL